MVKRYIYCVVLITAIISLGGCSKNKLGSNGISSVFDGEVSIKINGEEYECELRHTPEQVSRIEITKPEQLNGLVFTWEGNKYKILWKDLECEFNKDVLPQSAFMEAIVDVLNSITGNENLNYDSVSGEGSVFSGKCAVGDFEITADKNGVIKNVSIPSINLKADFTTNEQ